MNEGILFPSPNWFQSSGIGVSPDGWIVYGGPCKSLCVLEPLHQKPGQIFEGQSYQPHVINRALPEKIVSVDISPDWLEKKTILTGSADGHVKQWSLTHEDNVLKIKSTHSHEVHSNEKEGLAGVSYSNEAFAVTVGGLKNIVKWDTKSNVTKTYSNLLKNFKPICMSCSRHTLLNVAIGTKQGVVFVFDLNGAGKVVYKVRAHDEEILNLSWCPKFKVEVKKLLKEKVSVNGTSSLARRLERIRNEPEPEEDEMFLLDKKSSTIPEQKEPKTSDISTNGSKTIDIAANESQTVSKEESPADQSNEESPDQSEIVQEDDMFDIYKDHEADEFGHKKYQPETEFIKAPKEEAKPNDFLAECLKLKQDIMKRKEEPPSIASLVEALDGVHVAQEAASQAAVTNDGLGALHPHRHLLATVAKSGSIRVWSKTGKQVSAGGVCGVAPAHERGGRARGGERPPRQGPVSITLLWHTATSLLAADAKGQLLECNPLTIDCQHYSNELIHRFTERQKAIVMINFAQRHHLDIGSKGRLEWRVLHSHHKRNLFAVASAAPRVQTGDGDSAGDTAGDTAGDDAGDGAGDWPVLTAAQDRDVTLYSRRRRRIVRVLPTCGGFIYSVAPCPYDATRLAVASGDGTVRVWQTAACDGDRVTRGTSVTYWQNVQGKVLCVVWHPRREGRLAFATAEGRVGVLDARGAERAARALPPAPGGVYAAAWAAPAGALLASAGDLLLYDVERPDDAPTVLPLAFEGVAWRVTEVARCARGLLAGGACGGVALLRAHPPYDLVAATFPFAKAIHSLEAHPEQVSSGAGPSPHRDVIAATSLDRRNQIALLRITTAEDGAITMSTWKTLSGHRESVVRAAWSPHREGELLSTSKDGTVRIWDIVSGACTAIFPAHCDSTLGAAWAPAVAGAVVSGGADCALRLWRPENYPADKYVEPTAPSKRRKKPHYPARERRNSGAAAEPAPDSATEAEPPGDDAATSADVKPRASKRYMLPLTQRQVVSASLAGCEHLLRLRDEPAAAPPPGCGYLRMFGTIDDVNELLDEELSDHEARGATDAWVSLSLLRGNVADAVQYAARRDALCPHLLALAPQLSHKYWKDVTQLYIAQLDRLVAKGEMENYFESKSFGGPLLRKVAALLAVHDARGAAAALVDAALYKEAYLLCRVRYMDSIAEETLRAWMTYCVWVGALDTAALCHLALGDASSAALVLSRSRDPAHLAVAAAAARAAGRAHYAGDLAARAARDPPKKKQPADADPEEELKQLPTRLELLMKEKAEEEEGLGGEDCAAEQQEELKQEEIKQEELKQEEIKQEELKQEEIKQGELNQVELKQEEIKQEELKQEELKQEELKQEELKQEELKQED